MGYDKNPIKGAIPYSLELDGFSFAYPECTESVLQNLSLQIKSGSFTLLTGSTGCGKTTLLRCCKPELAPSGTRSGLIRLFGQDIETLAAETSAQLVGYVSQSPENQAICSEVWHELAFGLENLGMPTNIMRRRVAEVAHFLGLNSWLHEEVATLSGGQKQLLNLASVLVMRPHLLLLDEPTSQLDPVAARTFLHALFRVNRETGITVVVATHSPELMADYATYQVKLEPSTNSKNNTLEAPVPSPEHNDDRHGVQDSYGAPLYNDRANVTPSKKQTVISLREVTFSYKRGADPVLRDCNLEVARASIHALVGGNGCGKTTLLKLAAGLLSPQRGRIRNTQSDAQAFIPQDPRALFVCDTVLDELAEWATDPTAVEPMLETLHLSGLAHLHPYDLSGGQQQLLALGKVLLARPRLLLLDEPTKGLDPEAKLFVANLLDKARARGITICMSTHDLSFVSCLADQVTMLFDGQDACTEPARKFFAGNLFFKPTPDKFARMWDEQSETTSSTTSKQNDYADSDDPSRSTPATPGTHNG